MRVTEYDPASNASGIHGKIFVVTGGTGGLGKETVLELSKHKSGHIILTGRDAGRAQGVVDTAKSNGAKVVTFVACDLASLGSVKEAAQQIMDTVPRLDVLICNAGIMDVPAALTKDGYEIQFGTNHMGHALLMRLLLPSVQRANGRMVGLTSLGFSLAPRGGIQFDTLKTRRDSGFNASWTNYGQSKLANLLYVQAMARRFPEVTIVAIHPGVVKTDLVGKLSFWSRVLVNITSPFSQLEPQQGAYNQLWAATTSQAEIHTANFYEPVGDRDRESQYSERRVGR